MAKLWCLLATEKTTCFDLQRPLSGFDKFLAKRVLYIPEAVITAVPAPDDGCQYPKHIELPTEM